MAVVPSHTWLRPLVLILFSLNALNYQQCLSDFAQPKGSEREHKFNLHTTKTFIDTKNAVAIESIHSMLGRGGGTVFWGGGGGMGWCWFIAGTRRCVHEIQIPAFKFCIGCRMFLWVNRQFFFLSVVVDPLFSQRWQRCLHTLAADSDVVPFQVARAYSFVVSVIANFILCIE